MAVAVMAAACGDGGPETISGPVPVPNRGPQAVGAIPEQVLRVGETTAVDVSASFNDPDGDQLTYTAASSNNAVATVSVSAASVQIGAIARGIVTVTVTARDPDGLLAQQRFQVTVPNRAPESVGVIPDQILFAGQTATLDASVYFRDPDGDELTYEASSSDTTVVKAAVAGPNIAVRAVAAGTASVRVEARDPDGGSAVQVLRVTVANQAPEPVGAIPAQTITPGETATLDVSPYFSDPDGDELTFMVASDDRSVIEVSVVASHLTVTGLAPGTAAVTVTASDPNGLSAVLSFNVTVTPSSRGFRIELVLATPMTPSQETAIRRAAERWMTVLAPTELRDVSLNRTTDCADDPRFDRYVETIDDVMIVVAVGEVDGTGGTLARAGPCLVRSSTLIPVYGLMELDAADLQRLGRFGELEDLVLHEMGHVLGFGTIWHGLRLLRNPASDTERPDTHFAGPLATEAFDEAGGTGYEGAKVPVENRGGEGTRNGHWRETVMFTEVMTGVSDPGPEPLSAITIQSLADLGYDVDLAEADVYKLPDADAARAGEKADRLIIYGDDIWKGPSSSLTLTGASSA